MEEDDERSVSVDGSDDDSEYTYVTDEEEDEETESRKKGGWFGFLRRGKQHADSDEESYDDSDDDDDDDEGGSENDSSSADDGNNIHQTTATAAAMNDDHSTTSSSSSEEDILDQIDKYNPANNNIKEGNDEEEAILMAQAIQRVQQRIQKHGGDIYNVLDDRDKHLVDSLRGVEDESVIRDVVDKAEKEREREVGNSEGGKNNDSMVVKSEHNEGGEANMGVDHADSVNEVTEETIPTNKQQQPFIEHGVYVEESDLVKEVSGKLEEQVDENNGEKNQEEDDNDETEEEDEEEEDDEEEGPTLEEQRSLLSLAAEHDRVDVIKELLSISQNDEVNTSLLCGFSSASDDNNDDNVKEEENVDDTTTNKVVFVPPPLHAAVAHGSVNAASCLLRMGANPSIRPIVPAPYLSRNYQPSPTRRRSSMEEDRNYKKYHDMSAWELAFGSWVVVDNNGDEEDVEDYDDDDEEEEVTEKRGWFGFGGSKKEDDDTDMILQEHDIADNDGKQRIIRRRQPLNIAPKKLEGIRHAFTAEALRAIGADEVDRLQQLLDSGMDSKMEVAGKSLEQWAIEMEAEGCCELLHVDKEEIKAEHDPQDDVDESSPVANGNGSEYTPTAQPCHTSKQITASSNQQQPMTPIQDERLSGMSPKDILTLIQENENLIPALTTCRDDLAEETSACQNILRDVQASGGRGTLSSQSLLDLVHSLKERRREVEENVKSWQQAWEEREDELDFFWEEVLNDEWREHFAQSGILDIATDASSMMSSGSLTTNASVEDLSRRFCEVDNRVNTLRSSIANLAEECGRYQVEVEEAGLSGALSLTKSLRDELKEMERQLSEAKSGEAICRRKIELIQEQLSRSTEEAQESAQNGYIPAEQHGHGTSDTSPAEQGVGGGVVSSVPQTFADREVLEGAAYAEAYVHRGMERESNVLDHYEANNDEDHSALVESAPSPKSYHVNRPIGNDCAVSEDGDDESKDFVVVANGADETIPAEAAEEREAEIDDGKLLDDDEPQETDTSASFASADLDFQEEHDVSIDEIDTPKRPPESAFDALKPSDALKSGMSTAIVVRQPTGHAGSLSLQLWELLRRIVGLGRTPSNYRTQSESSTNIMIV